MDGRRFDKTTQGHEEITQGRKTLRGKLRTVLFLVDTSKTADAIQQQIHLIGAPPDALAQLEAAGYIRAVGSPGVGRATHAPPTGPKPPGPMPMVPVRIETVPTESTATESTPTESTATESTPTEPESSSESSDAPETFRAAKAFMNETVVDAIGIRAFALTLKMERCKSVADLEALLPAYAAALSKKLDTSAVHALVERAKALARAGRS